MHLSHKTYILVYTHSRTTNLMACQTPCTVKHFHIECKAFTHIRKCIFNVYYMKYLFENINVDEVLSFWREIKLYQKI